MEYRKRPIVVNAHQVPEKCEMENMFAHGVLGAWLMRHSDIDNWKVANGDGEIDIETLEGTMRANNGDWIIKDAFRIYPCKPDIFKATYEPVLKSPDVPQQTEKDLK